MGSARQSRPVSVRIPYFSLQLQDQPTKPDRAMHKSNHTQRDSHSGQKPKVIRFESHDFFSLRLQATQGNTPLALNFAEIVLLEVFHAGTVGLVKPCLSNDGCGHGWLVVRRH